jgi:uncharacterized protein (DUF362 family)
MLSERGKHVALAWGPERYDAPPPFSPGVRWPEYPFKDAGESNGENRVYSTVREAFHLLGFDRKKYGHADWNPLGEMIKPGDTVALKPNFVREFRDSIPGHDRCITTEGSVIRAVADYVYIAMKGEGRIIIADAPHNDADFQKVLDISRPIPVVKFYRDAADFNLELYDLRPEAADKVDGVIVGHRELHGDPAGFVRVDLGPHSAFNEVQEKCHLLYGSEYDTTEIVSHHTGGRHEYLVCKTILDADVVISLPKLKTHKKTGITVNMKNLVGINGNKNWLPHHREGTPSQGGDQFMEDTAKRRVEQSTVATFKKLFPLLGPLRPIVAGPIKAMGKRVFGDTNVDTVRSGNWYGNDTTWRMVIDLNRMLWYAGADGRLYDTPQRKFLSVVDGIIGMEGNGPMDGTAKPAGVILVGTNPVAVDLACARVMGLDWERLPVLHRVLEDHAFPLAVMNATDVAVHSNRNDYNGNIGAITGEPLNFKPHFGWVGHVEWDPARAAATSS